MHMPLYRALARNQTDSVRDTVQHLSASGHHTILLSCEHLVFIRSAAFRALRNLLGNADVTIDDTAPPFHQAFDNMSAYADRVAGATTLFERRRKQTPYIQPFYLAQDGVREDRRELYHRLTSETGIAHTAA